MKFLLLLLVLFVAVWAWRSGRTSDAAARRQPPTPPRPQEMAACALCGMHFPEADAIHGVRGLYCCDAHRQRAES